MIPAPRAVLHWSSWTQFPALALDFIFLQMLVGSSDWISGIKEGEMFPASGFGLAFPQLSQASGG